MKYTSPARRAAAAAVLVGALGATGCSAINYQATTHVYSGSDGTMFDAEDVALRHMVLVAGEEGGAARLLGLASHTNSAAAGPAEVSLEVAGDSFDLTLEPGEAVNLEHDEEFIVSAIDTGPGSLQEVTVAVDGTEETFNATVVDGTLEEYRDLLPDGFDATVLDHLEHGPDTWGGGAAHYDADGDGH
ncbi:hypothetical protein [Nesterenkonia sphaerica]|uniref:DNA modification methylase n=1 Tax=Nesterenkonia sphaerica TaxID=1804988 RepID=A0A5R9A0G7_9MICC|nr:hypothetical protein [Nesterenkonia sphaerica]TLP71266.1 hypothetical protein FEF27_12510 [Nesterenkonia sphaerica]